MRHVCALLTFICSLGCITSWTIGGKAQQFMKRFPQELIDIIEALNQTRTAFNSNCRKMQSVVDTKLPILMRVPQEIYSNISLMVDEATHEDYPLLLEKFNNLSLKIKEMYQRIGQ